MTIKLYNNLSENNIINKTITQVGSDVTATIKGDISVESPTLILNYSGNMHNINYFYIPEFYRFYYITDLVELTGGRYQIQGKTDVLESFKQSILNLSVIIDKQENSNLIDFFLDDGSYVNENKEFQRVINFPTGFNEDGEYILITAGGGGGII